MNFILKSLIACQKSWKSLRKMNGLPVTWQWMDFKRKFCESVLVLVFCYYLGFILMTSVVVFMLWTSSWFLAMNFLLSMIYFQFHACEMSTSSHNFPESQSTRRSLLLRIIELNNFQVSKSMIQDFDNFTRKNKKFSNEDFF